MKVEEIKTSEDLLAYIHEYESSIFIREQIDGKWGGYALSELSYSLRVKHIMRFVGEGIVPVRLKGFE